MGSGRFLLLNRILCQSADDDGAFRPSDIFTGTTVNAVVTTPLSKPVAQVVRNGSLPVSTEEILPALADLSAKVADVDCPIFNTFGVLSGGIMIDPWNATFVDFTDPEVFQPSILASSDSLAERQTGVEVRKGVVQTGQVDESRVTTSNSRYYQQGLFGSIKPEAAITLCASVHPLGCGGAQRTTYTDEEVTRASRRSRQAARQASARLCKDMLSACAFPEAAWRNKGTFAKFLAQWDQSQRYRLRSWSTSPAQTAIPPVIPYKFQLGGKILSERKSNDTEKGSSTSICPSPASFFYCFTGKPSWSSEYREGIRRDVSMGRQGRSNLQVTRHIFTPANKHAEDATLDDLFFSDAFLHPTQLGSHWYQAWWVFSTYYHNLGIRTSHNRERFTMVSDDQYCVAASIEERVQQERLKEQGSSDGAPLDTTKRSEKSAAWCYLLLHDKETLLRRLYSVQVYLHNYNAERRKKVTFT